VLHPPKHRWDGDIRLHIRCPCHQSCWATMATPTMGRSHSPTKTESFPVSGHGTGFRVRRRRHPGQPLLPGEALADADRRRDGARARHPRTRKSCAFRGGCPRIGRVPEASIPYGDCQAPRCPLQNCLVAFSTSWARPHWPSILVDERVDRVITCPVRQFCEKQPAPLSRLICLVQAEHAGEIGPDILRGVL
jgi:hypothetical protein